MKPEAVASALEDCPLHRKTPFAILNVSATQFSVARHFGGCNYNGEHYIYNPKTDELIRADVLKWLNKRKKAKADSKAVATEKELL